jgi:hypothetical protein
MVRAVTCAEAQARCQATKTQSGNEQSMDVGVVTDSSDRSSPLVNLQSVKDADALLFSSLYHAWLTFLSHMLHKMK